MESKTLAENLKEMVSAVGDYEKFDEKATLEGYLDQVSLFADAYKLDDKKNCVTLMTMHNAKGLEFPLVFITGMEEALFPHNNSMEKDEEVQEERRLCYVGMTRAMDILYLTGAACRYVYGTPQWRAPSRFLSQIPKDMIQVTGKAASIVATQGGLYEVEGAKKKKAFDELKDPEWDEEGVAAPYALGETVKHKKFRK